MKGGITSLKFRNLHLDVILWFYLFKLRLYLLDAKERIYHCCSAVAPCSASQLVA